MEMMMEATKCKWNRNTNVRARKTDFMSNKSDSIQKTEIFSFHCTIYYINYGTKQTKKYLLTLIYSCIKLNEKKNEKKKKKKSTRKS